MVQVIGFKDLYSAWEDQIYSTINDLKIDDDTSRDGAAVQVEAIQTEYLELAPKILCLQLNRLQYKDAEAIKHRHKVEMEKTIMLDRFMLQNKDKQAKIRQTVQALRHQIACLEDSIGKYTNFWDSDHDIRAMLNFVSEFIENQNKNTHV